MDKTAATFIIESLANGVDPFSGEELQQTGALQSPDAVRALRFALSKIDDNQFGVELLHVRDGDLVNCKNEEMWHEYCELVKCEEAPSNIVQDKSEDDGEDALADAVEIEDDYFEHDESYDYDFEDSMDDIRQEIDEHMENHARSEETGWYYPDSEGSWEDNLSNDDGGYMEYHAVAEETAWYYPNNEGSWEDNSSDDD